MDRPCRDNPSRWWSLDALEVAAAVRACHRCSHLEACHQLAVELEPPGGVWAGVRWRPHPSASSPTGRPVKRGPGAAPAGEVA